jgi:AraC-like DNA-binding protein
MPQIQLEKINPDLHSSFRWLINPRLNDFYFWHFHPELELVYIEGVDGTRHVGDHLGRFVHSDLVLIGSHIPHLNFDYGAKGFYEKIVLHIAPDFLAQALDHTPELAGIRRLLRQSQRGVAFGEATQKRLSPLLKQLHQLTPLRQFTEVVALLDELAEAPDKTFLHPLPFKNQFNEREQARLQRIYAFIDAHFQRKIDLDEMAQISHLSKGAFCRYFKKMTRLTFTDFLNHYRVNQAKNLLLQDQNVTETCFQCGFESLSYFNRIFKKITQENPLQYKKRHTLG